MVQKRTVSKSKSPIPHKIHFIWLGTNVPSYMKKFMKSFEKYAPGYKLRLWGENDITKKTLPKTFDIIQKVKKYQGEKIREYTDQKTMYKTKGDPYTYSKYAQISDLMRYEIVFNEGGYYFDANMFLLKDITKLFERKEKFVGCNELGNNLKKSEILSNSFFGAIPKSPVLSRLLTDKFIDNLDLRTLDVDFVTGPGALRSVLKLSKDSYHIFPANTFYPYILPWTADGDDHPLRKSSDPKCTGPTKTKKRTVKMKKNLWLEYPCKQYKGSYGIKVWESGGSWSRPKSWHEKEGSKMKTYYAEGGVACVPCAAPLLVTPVGAAAVGVGVCAYGIKKGYDKLKDNPVQKKGSKKKSKKKDSKKKSKKKPKKKSNKKPK